MVDRIEEFLQVDVHYPLVAFLDVERCLQDRLVRVPARTESVAVLAENVGRNTG